MGRWRLHEATAPPPSTPHAVDTVARIIQAAYRERLLSTGDRELVEMPNRGQGGPWTGGPGGLNWNGKANMRVRDALRAQDWQQELARLVAECDAIRASFV